MPHQADKRREIGVPPKKESSYNVRLELKIKGVNHGQKPHTEQVSTGCTLGVLREAREIHHYAILRHWQKRWKSAYRNCFDIKTTIITI